MRVIQAIMGAVLSAALIAACTGETDSNTGSSSSTSSSSGASSSSGGSSSSSSSASSSSGAGGANAFGLCTDTTGTLKDCKNCCDCASTLSCADQRACRDTCNALGDMYFAMNPNPMPVNAPSVLGKDGDYSACTALATEQDCKECCDCSVNFVCGDHQFCRNACIATFGDGGVPNDSGMPSDGG